MKKMLTAVVVAVVSVSVLAMVAGAQQIQNGTFGGLSGKELRADKVKVPESGLQINGTNVTVSATEINAAVAIGGGGSVAASTITGNIAESRVTNALATGTAYTISAARLTAGTVASVISGQSITNLNGANLQAVSVPPAAAGEGIVVSPTGYSGTGVKIQFGTIPTNSVGTTITFAEAFTAVPAVIVGAEAATTGTWYVASVTASNFVVYGEELIGGGYIAVGLK